MSRASRPFVVAAHVVLALWLAFSLTMAMGHAGVRAFFRLHGRLFHDSVGPGLARWARARPRLPARGEIGFFHDRMVGIGTDDFTHGTTVLLSQYSLWPLVLREPPGHDVVVGDTRTPTARDRAVERWSLELVEDCGNGIAVLRRRGP